ncbi:hypothetical protein [Paracidovorax anthurii]|uniref:Uncharacterized protein n=1 Tax=Paracidovorax anthurii TaxID=78229 RepID=A0A328YFE4_9BURK|nr:hypothetical protein [Paracidovorax anthurii]RAR72738.1 hypothetical protein AX018_107613 [Paracidovorax anthurii]
MRKHNIHSLKKLLSGGLAALAVFAAVPAAPAHAATIGTVTFMYTFNLPPASEQELWNITWSTAWNTCRQYFPSTRSVFQPRYTNGVWAQTSAGFTTEIAWSCRNTP